MTIGYIRVSTSEQNIENHEHKILSYAHEIKPIIDEFVEIKISSKNNFILRSQNDAKLFRPFYRG